MQKDIHNVFFGVRNVEITLLNITQKVTDFVSGAVQIMEQRKVRKMSEWIPMTTRPMTEEEKEDYKEQLEYCDSAVIYDCPLPEDGQEVLITVYLDSVQIDTFYNDPVEGCYFDGYDIEDVKAWMPLPEPYREDMKGETK